MGLTFVLLAVGLLAWLFWAVPALADETDEEPVAPRAEDDCAVPPRRHAPRTAHHRNR